MKNLANCKPSEFLVQTNRIRKSVENWLTVTDILNIRRNQPELKEGMTKEERHLWYDFLRGYPVRFLRQKVIDNYIVDFYCHAARLIIELDGSQHYEESGVVKDKIRTEKLGDRNLTVIRIPNSEVNTNFRGVCEYIDLCVKESLSR